MSSYFAIDLSPQEIRWAQSHYTGRSTKLRHSERYGFQSQTDLEAYIADKLLPQIKPRDEVVVLLKPPHLFYRQLGFPFAATRKIDAALPLEMAGKLPLPLNRLELARGPAETTSAGNTQVSAVALPVDSLEQLRQKLAAAQLPVTRFEPAPFALTGGVALEHPSCFLIHVDDDGGSACLMDKGQVKVFRMLGPLGHLSQNELAATIARAVAILKREVNSARLPAVLIGPRATSSLQQALEKLNLKTRDLRLPQSTVPVDPAEQAAVCLALGVSGVPRKQRLHFPGSPQQDRHIGGRLTSPRANIAIGGLTLALVLLACGWTYQLKASRQQQLKRQIQQVYRDTFGTNSSSPDVSKEMRIKLRDLKARGQRLQPAVPTPLAFLASVSRTLPEATGVKLTAYGYEEAEARLEGQCPDFDALDRIKTQLEGLPGVKETQISDAQRQAGGTTIGFRIRLRFNAGDA